MEKQNRAQRRKSKFGQGRATELGGWPTTRPNPVFGTDPTDDAVAGRPDQDQTDLVGPGTGGATEHADRMPEHEGVHGSNSAKS